jgi:hypothetical protein
MEKLCFGTLFTVLCQAKMNTSQEVLYARLLNPNISKKEDLTLDDKGSVSRRKKGIEDIPDISKSDFLEIPFDDVVEGYQSNLIKSLNEKKLKLTVLALKDIISKDESLKDEDKIYNQAYTKERIFDSNKFNYFELIAIIMEYVCSIDNIVEEITISENFIDSFEEYKEEITLVGNGSRPICPLNISAKKEKFLDVFKEVELEKNTLKIPNPSQLKIFHLKIKNSEFYTKEISTFIRSNISRYVLSRSDYSRLKREDPEDINLSAFNKFKSETESTSISKQFEEFMVYSFLECSLHAPKIMSGIEIETFGKTFTNKSEGIYLLPAGELSKDNQIVFAASNSTNSLKEAVTSAIKKAAEIKNGLDAEYKIFDPSIVNQIVDGNVSSYIKDIALPDRHEKTKTNDSFGIFLSYSIHIKEKEKLSNDEYEVAVEEQMEQDIKDVYTLLCNSIAENKLTSHSFYLFILPLDDATNDPEIIIKDSFGGSI